MSVGDKATELLKTVVDKTKEDKQYDEKVVLQETKQKLLGLKEDVSYATVVLEELKKTGWVDEVKFQTIEGKLRDAAHNKEAISDITNVLEEIYASYDTLQTDQKEKVRTMTDALRQSKEGLSGLKNEVMQKVNYETLEKELTDEAEAKLGAHRYSKWLIEPYKKHIHEKVAEMKAEKTVEKSGWQKFVALVKDGFFALVIGWVGGKAIGDIVRDKIGAKKEQIVDGVKKIAEEGKKKVEEGKEKIEKVQEKVRTPEELKEEEIAAKKYIRTSVKKYFKKDLTDEQVDRIAVKMNLSQQLKDGTSEWRAIIDGATHGQDVSNRNYLDATLQTVTMPVGIFFHLVSVLDEEGIVDMKEAGLHIVGNTVEYGLKGFELFGAGLATLVGKMDLKELNGHIAHLYEKSPTAAKYILFGLIYRSMDGPLMKMVLNTGAFMSKAVIWPLFEAKSDAGLVKDMAHDALAGNMNTAIKDMKETNELLKKCNISDPFLQELMDEVEKAAKKAELYNSIVVEAQSIEEGADFMKTLKKKFPSGSEAQKYIADYESSTRSAINKSRFLDNVGATWENETKIMHNTLKSVNGKWGVEFKNWGAKLFLGESSPRHLMISFAQNIEAQGKVAHEMLANRNLFDQISDKLYLKKVRAMSEVMHGNELKDKAVWKFNTVDELEDFTENANLLARKAPSTVKFIFSKAPIFIVGGLAMSEGDTMSEKMHALWEGMLGLVPVVGPIMILRDGLWAGENTNWGQATVGGALLGVDGIHFINALRGQEKVTKLIHMFTQPAMDMVEIGRFIRNTGKNSYKMIRDGAKLVREGKTAGMWEAMIESIKGTPKKKWAIIGAVAAIVGGTIYEMMPEGIDKEAEVMFTKYKDDPNGLDKALAENWPTFDQDTKNECIKYALIAKLGMGPEQASKMAVDYVEGAYRISIPMMIEKQYGNAMLASLQDSLARVEPDAKIHMNVKGIVAYNFRKELAEQLKAGGEKPENIEKIIDAKLAAMGYDPDIGKQTTS